MMRKIDEKVFEVLLLGLVVVIVLSIYMIFSNACDACEREKPAVFSYNNKTFDCDYFTYDNRLLVQLRDISENLGLTIDWDEQSKAIYVGNNKAQLCALFTLNSKNVKIFKFGNLTPIKTIKMEVAPVIRDGYTYMPIRYAVEPIGKKISYKETKTQRIITITD